MQARVPKRKKTPRRLTHRSFDSQHVRPDGMFMDTAHFKRHKNTEKQKAQALKKSPKWHNRVRKEGRCAYCATPLTVHTATMDHIVPLSRGGTTTLANLVVACRSCNMQKHARTAVEWLVFDQADHPAPPRSPADHSSE